MSLRAAREAAMQVLYGYDISGEAPESLEDVAATEDRDLNEEDKAYLAKVRDLMPDKLADVDNTLQANLFNWKISRLSKVDLAILRLAILEMEHMGMDTPPKTLLTEMMEIAEQYSGNRSSRFINGVLAGYFEQMGIDGFHVDRSDQIRRVKEAEEEEKRKLEKAAATSQAASGPELSPMGVSFDELDSGSAPRKDDRKSQRRKSATAATSGLSPRGNGPGAAAKRARSDQRQTGRGAASRPRGRGTGAAGSRGGPKAGPGARKGPATGRGGWNKPRTSAPQGSKAGPGGKSPSAKPSPSKK